MKPFVIIKLEIAFQAYVCVMRRLVVIKIDFFIFERPPESFDEDIIEATTTPVHADVNMAICQHSSKIIAGKLRALIGVENRWLSMTERFLQHLKAEMDIQCV